MVGLVFSKKILRGVESMAQGGGKNPQHTGNLSGGKRTPIKNDVDLWVWPEGRKRKKKLLNEVPFNGSRHDWTQWCLSVAAR